MDKTKTIHLDPNHCEVDTNSDGFVLTFWGRTEGGKSYRVKFRMQFWWVRFLARDLWKVIKQKKTDLAAAEHALTTGQD